MSEPKLNKIEKVVKSIWPLGDNFQDERDLRRQLRALVKIAWHQGRSTGRDNHNSNVAKEYWANDFERLFGFKPPKTLL